jgi:two-component system, cell cycle sensor histidine kinase and response regulator CckA
VKTVSRFPRGLWHTSSDDRRTDPFPPDTATAAFYRSLVDQAHDVTLVVDRTERVAFVSRAAAAVLGYPQDDLLGQPFVGLVHDDDRPGVRAALAHLGDEPHSVLARFGHADGSWRSLECAVFACHDPYGRSVRLITARDVTSLQALRERSAQHDRRAYIGHAAASLALDLDRVFEDMDPHLRLIEGQAPHLHDAAGRLRALLDGAEALIDRLMAVAQGDPAIGAPIAVDAHGVIAENSALLRTLVRRSVRIVYGLDAEYEWLAIDRAALAQVLVQLIVNARDAMPNGGLVTVATYNSPRIVAPHHGDLEPWHREWFTLEVSDLGVGMTADIKARIFEPFFTTKTHQGLGLGLTTALDIVTRAGGQIDVESGPGQGATFRVHLPLHPRPALS